MRAWRFLLSVVLAQWLIAAGSCVRTIEKTTTPPSSAADDKTTESGPPPAAPRFSAPAFLDRSLYVLDRELSSTRSGKMLRDALYFPTPARVLLFISDFDTVIPERRAGGLYLVLADDPTTTYALKGEAEVLSLHRAPDEREVYFEVLQKLEAAVPEQPGEDAAQGGQSDGAPLAPDDYAMKLHRLTSAGKDEDLALENVQVMQVLPGGKLVLGEVRDITHFAGTYFVSLGDAYKLYDVRRQKDVRGFDYQPLVSPELDRALRVVTNYDPSNYEDCFFAVYAGSCKELMEELEPILICPMFLTFTEERWQPVVQFARENELLLSRFAEDTDSTQTSTRLPYTTGKLSLGMFDLRTREFTPVIPAASPYLRVFYIPDESVFFYAYYDLVGEVRRYRVIASSIDGTTTRELYVRDGAERLSLTDVDIGGGSLLLVESCVEADGGYSLLRELRLTKEPPPPAGAEVEPVEEAEAAAPAEAGEDSRHTAPSFEEAPSLPRLDLPLDRA